MTTTSDSLMAENEERQSKKSPRRFRTKQGDVVLIGDFELFQKKKQQLIVGGAKKLQVISDFDRTLTKPTVNGKPGQTTYGVLSCGVLSEKFHRIERELFEQYHPFEIDPLLSRDKKFPLMEEWWQKATQNLIESNVSRRMIGDMVQSVGGLLSFREGTLELLDELEKAGIPTLVLSAGLGDTIDFAFAQRLPRGIRPNMHVVANFLSYEGGPHRRISSPSNDHLPLDQEDRIATGIKGPSGRLIHVLNKDESGIRGTPYFQEVSSRPNVILLGDHLGDLRMADGLSHQVCLTIGFLNDKAATDPVHLEVYSKSFDVVILAPSSSSSLSTPSLENDSSAEKKKQREGEGEVEGEAEGEAEGEGEEASIHFAFQLLQEILQGGEGEGEGEVRH